MLQAYRTLCGVYVGAQSPPVSTMSSRNDILALAHIRLGPTALEAFLQHAASLSRELCGVTVVKLPEPLGVFNPLATEAEQLCLALPRKVWAHCGPQYDPWWPCCPLMKTPVSSRTNFICTLGLLSKRGTHGLTKHTGAHKNVCRLLKQMVRTICPDLGWSSLTLTLDNRCKPHTDTGNWHGDSFALPP